MSKLTREFLLEKINELPFKGKEGGNPVESGVISSVVIKDSNIGIVVEAANLPEPEKFISALEKKIKQIEGVNKVNIVLTSEISGAPETQAKKVKNVPPPPTPSPLEGIKNIILVGSGKGGVGKSTVAVNLAVSLAKLGYKTGLVDADIHGPSVAKMLSIKNQPDVENNQIIPPESFGIKAMSMGFLIDENAPVVWRGPMISKALYQLLRGAKWGELDYLVIDMPPGTGDIHLSIAQNFMVKGAVIVSTPQEIALLDVKKCINMLKKVNIPILGIIENMSYFESTPGDKTYIFGPSKGRQLAAAVEAEYLGDIPILPEISQGGDNGRPVSAENNAIADSFKRIASKIISKIG